MKRSYALKLIANQLDFLNNKFAGVRTSFSNKELRNADVILTTLESAGMQPPAIPEPGQPLHPENSYINEWETE